tara:strand:+ start:180 stop:473 length:294 start_codon:yes stop_codon:yes gene_type:complete
MKNDYRLYALRGIKVVRCISISTVILQMNLFQFHALLIVIKCSISRVWDANEHSSTSKPSKSRKVSADYAERTTTMPLTFIDGISLELREDPILGIT